MKNAASESERLAAEFVLKLLKKRLFSSPASFGTTLEKHAATVGGNKKASSYARDMDDYEDDYADDEEYETQIGEVMASVSQSLLALSTEERNLLSDLRQYAAKAILRPDCKAQALVDWLKKTLKSNGSWNEERVVLFTEYRATQKWLHDLVAREGFAAGSLAVHVRLEHE